jgi:hypothetical protein
MNQEILKAHALVAQKKLSWSDFEAMLLGIVAGNRKPVIKPKVRKQAQATTKQTKP